MKGHYDIIYLATEGKDYGNTGNNDFNIVLSEPPTDKMFKKYISERLVLDLLDRLKVVCGNGAMRFVEKQIESIKENRYFKE